MIPLVRSFLPRLPRSSPRQRQASPGVPRDSGRRRSKDWARRPPDQIPFVRQVVQVAFLLLNLWIGIQFYTFVRYYETGGATLYLPRPPGVEGWLPIAALMNLKRAVLTGQLPEVHAAGMFLLAAFLAMSLLARKAFCSWLCPIGTLSEWLWQGGEALLGRTLRLPRWVDVPLRSLKYILLGLFLAAVGSMSADAIRAFLTSPYGLIADVKMLDFFQRMGTTTAAVLVVLVVASVLVKNAWCRYLCPYGALLGLVGLLSPARIRRDPDACIDCEKCAKACPALLPVDRLVAVRSAECTACLSCVAACPARGALDLAWGPRRAVAGWVVPAIVVGVFLGVVILARATGHWHTVLPDAVYFELIPRAGEFTHP